MQPTAPLDAWADEIARAEGAALADAVREGVAAGRGLGASLALLRARMERLTPAQRERLIASIPHGAGPAAG